MLNKSGIIEEKQRYNAPFLRAFDLLAAQIAGGKQKNLAEMMGTYSSHISDYRNGKKRVSPEMMDSLIRVSEQIPGGTINRYYLTGSSQYMLLRNVPDAEIIAQQGREFDPDYDIINSDTPSTSVSQQEKDIISLATDLIVELEQLCRQTQNELALLVQARQSFDTATAQLQKFIQSTHTKHPIDYFPNIAAEDTENK